jgi:hypothetical protein
MAHKQKTPFTLKSGNKTSFKAMGSSPMRIRFASPEAAASPAGQAILPQGGMNGQATATQQGPNTMMNAQAPAQANPVQAPQAAVQSAPRPDLSGGPRQPMGGLGQPMNAPRQPMNAPRQPMGGPRQPMGGPGFGGPGQLPPNKGRRRPGMGDGMGIARRDAGLARRARRATGLARRARRSRG